MNDVRARIIADLEAALGDLHPAFSLEAYDRETRGLLAEAQRYLRPRAWRRCPVTGEGLSREEAAEWAAAMRLHAAVRTEWRPRFEAAAAAVVS